MTIPLFKVLMTEEAGPALLETLKSGYIGQGPRVDEFEKLYAGTLELHPDRLLALNSCTSAIDLALHLCGVGPGDRVLVTPMTCSATITPIVNRGAVPVWTDVDPITGNMDPQSAGNNWTRKVKAVLAVNWGGLPCEYDAIRDATLGDAPIIEDAAHSLLPQVGGDYVCWSFQAIKFLTTGDGGALYVPKHQAERARLLRWFGLDRNQSAAFRCAQRIHEAGYKYHMNDLAASIGIHNLPLAVWAVGKHQKNALILTNNINHPEVKLAKFSSESSYWIYTVRVKRRDRFIEYLKLHGIDSSPVHSRNDHQPAFRRAAGREYNLPGLDRFAAENVAIPVGWWLTQGELEYIINTINQWSD